MFLVIAVKSRTFPVLCIQLRSRCAGAGREQSQAASPSWPVEMFHTIGVMLSLGMGAGRGIGMLFLCDSSFSGNLNFSMISVSFSGVLRNSWSLGVLCSTITAWGLAMQLVIRQ